MKMKKKTIKLHTTKRSYLQGCNLKTSTESLHIFRQKQISMVS